MEEPEEETLSVGFRNGTMRKTAKDTSTGPRKAEPLKIEVEPARTCKTSLRPPPPPPPPPVTSETSSLDRPRASIEHRPLSLSLYFSRLWSPARLAPAREHTCPRETRRAHDRAREINNELNFSNRPHGPTPSPRERRQARERITITSDHTHIQIYSTRNTDTRWM